MHKFIPTSLLATLFAAIISLTDVQAQAESLSHWKLAPTPPMGWNSYDAYECETAGMRNINARHIDVLHYCKNHHKPTDYWASAIIWLQPNQNMLMENCHFEDISVRSSGEDVIMLMAKPMSCHYGSFKNPEPGTLRDCSFKDIQVVGERGSFQGLLYMSGDSQQHNVSRLFFEHITYFGQSLTQDSPCVQIGSHVTGITFQK